MSVDLAIIPVNDLVDHDGFDEDCVCGPTSDVIFDEDGSVSWMLVHHALDGRE